MASPGRKLTDCPSNLKEAIDWILRVTGKDGGGVGQNGTKELANAVSALLDGVEFSETGLQKTLSDIKETLKTDDGNGLIGNMAAGLADFIGYQSSGSGGEIGDKGIAVPQSGTKKPFEKRETAKGIYGMYETGYIWSYPQGATWTQDFNKPDTDYQKAAKIFLSCVPIVFYALGLLYWRCRNSGKWKTEKINESAVGTEKNLCYFLSSQGFVRTELSGKKGQEILDTAFKGFGELSSAVKGSNSFIGFFNNIHSNLRNTLRTTVSNITNLFKTHSISLTFLFSSAYFTHNRHKYAQSNPPSSIRQMLYWLSGLTITPQFGDLLMHCIKLVPDDFKIAVSGSSKQKEQLTADDLMGHLITSCLSSSWVLGTIQGAGGLEKPLLHEIFVNSENLEYASSVSSLFNTLSSYTYALQFQLTFLFRYCQYEPSHGCGWLQCKFGHGINSDASGPRASWICSISFCENYSSCSHNSSSCQHFQKCGVSSQNASPLQAFLTDNLKGFRRETSDSSNHLSECTVGYMCHVPMGFKNYLPSSPKTGDDIRNALLYLCGDYTNPLRQLGEKLSCLTKRTPRSLGEMFGFLTQLAGQAFSNLEVQNSLRLAVSSSTQASKSIKEFITSPRNQSSLLTDSLSTLTNQVTFWETLDGYFAVSSLASGLYNLNQHCHKVETDSVWGLKTRHDPNGCSRPHDLRSLFIMVNESKTPECVSKQCGPYLNPLVYSSGSTFSPNYSSTYLSWILYLHDDFYNWFHNMVDDLSNVKCSSISGGNHAAGCPCPSVVQCSEVLPQLYSRGFNFYSVSWLTSKKVMCQKFHDQLKAVAEGEPINDLLTIIDEFLYIFRYSFLHKVSACWTIYICLILYTFIFHLDALKLLSLPLKTSSHSIAPAAILAEGKPISVTKLAYLVS